MASEGKTDEILSHDCNMSKREEMEPIASAAPAGTKIPGRNGSVQYPINAAVASDNPDITGTGTRARKAISDTPESNAIVPSPHEAPLESEIPQHKEILPTPKREQSTGEIPEKKEIPAKGQEFQDVGAVSKDCLSSEGDKSVGCGIPEKEEMVSRVEDGSVVRAMRQNKDTESSSSENSAAKTTLEPNQPAVDQSKIYHHTLVHDDWKAYVPFFWFRSKKRLRRDKAYVKEVRDGNERRRKPKMISTGLQTEVSALRESTDSTEQGNSCQTSQNEKQLSLESSPEVMQVKKFKGKPTFGEKMSLRSRFHVKR